MTSIKSKMHLSYCTCEMQDCTCSSVTTMRYQKLKWKIPHSNVAVNLWFYYLYLREHIFLKAEKYSGAITFQSCDILLIEKSSFFIFFQEKCYHQQEKTLSLTNIHAIRVAIWAEKKMHFKQHFPQNSCKLFFSIPKKKLLKNKLRFEWNRNIFHTKEMLNEISSRH